MHGLRVKLALIFVGSVLAVVLVATAVTALMLSIGDTDRLMGPMARHMAIANDIIAAGPDGGARELRQPPDKPRFKPSFKPPFGPDRVVEALPEGVARPELAAALQRALSREGEVGPVEVIERGGGERIAAQRLADGRYMLFPFPRPQGPPPELWLALLAWLALVVIGVLGAAVALAWRATQPFAVLERAIGSVGTDGVLPHVPETGGSEARQTAVALNALSDRLKAAMESRMRLVAAAGHDLRTPMTRMRLRAEFLPEEDRASWLNDLDELDAIADSAIRLVQEEGAGEDRRPVELDRLVRETATELAAAGLPVTLGETVPAVVTAGPLALRRALRNLITNGATHGGGAAVRLQIEGDEAMVIIEDDGPGIPDELIPQAFEPFFRVNPGRLQITKGAGLGLAIAREIIERFAGSIAISNRPEGGLRQVVRLRLSTPPAD
jgi:signal transduction histidine kinase